MPTWSAPISLKGVKGDSTPQTLPNDLTPNSVTVSPVSGDTAASQLSVTSSSGSTLFKADGSGNVTVAGSVNVAGASTVAALTASSASIAGNESVGGNLTVTGTITAGAITGSSTNIAGSQTVQGNDTITGNLSVGGTSSLQGAVTCGSDLTATGGNTKLGPLSCTTLSASGAASFATTVAVTGTITPGAVNCQNNTNVGKNLVVSGTTQTVGLLTASGNVSTPAMNVTAGGTSVLGTASADALTTSGNINIGGTATLQTVNAAAITTSGNFRSNGNLSCTSGTTTLGGPVNISGTTTAAAVNATNVSASGTLSVTGATTLGALTASSSSVAGSETVAATLTAKNVTLASGGGGAITFADGTSQTTAATSGSGSGGTGGASGSRFTISAGGFYSTNAAANALYTLSDTASNDGNLTASPAVIHTFWKVPFAFSITGWSVQQYVTNGANFFQVTRNRTSGSLNSILTQSVGTPTVSGFPGNQFSGTWTKGTYAFAAGDTLSLVYQHSTGTSTNVKVLIYGEWT